MTASSRIDRSRRSLASASLLLAEGDVDGACNRAYYAMFYAAKAAQDFVEAMARLVAKPPPGPAPEGDQATSPLVPTES